MSALVELPVAFGPGQYVRPEAVTCIRSRNHGTNPDTTVITVYLVDGGPPPTCMIADDQAPHVVAELLRIAALTGPRTVIL